MKEPRDLLFFFILLGCLHTSEQRVSVRIESSKASGSSGYENLNERHEYRPQEQQKAKQSRARMHIVIAHYSKDTVQATLMVWTRMLSMDKIKALEPKVFVYCQNPLVQDLRVLQPLLVWGGEIKHVENMGRESHSFLLHILHYYHELPDIVLFSQDMPEESLMQKRIEKLLVPETGFLPLALVASEPCFTEWLQGGLVAQLFSWLRKAFCPPEGIAMSFMGQFIVSRDRLLSVEASTYQYLLDMLRAPSSHWIHSVHGIEHLKSPRNPMFGHVLERSWAVAFDCCQHWKVRECRACDQSSSPSCNISTCQCLDPRPTLPLPKRGNTTDATGLEVRRKNPRRPQHSAKAKQAYLAGG